VLEVLTEALVPEDDDWVELGTVKVKLGLETLVVTDEEDWVGVWLGLWDEIRDEVWLLEDEPWLLVPLPPSETHGTTAVVVEPDGIVMTVEHAVVCDELAAAK